MNYYLIGMMGSGKTTIGNLLSKKLDHNFFDIDLLLTAPQPLALFCFIELTIEEILEGGSTSLPHVLSTNQGFLFNVVL